MFACSVKVLNASAVTKSLTTDVVIIVAACAERGGCSKDDALCGSNELHKVKGVLLREAAWKLRALTPT